MYAVQGYPYVRGCNSIEFIGRSVRTVAAVCYIVDVRNSGVSIKRGFTVHTHTCSCFLLPYFLTPQGGPKV